MQRALVRVTQILLYSPPIQLDATRSICIQCLSRDNGFSRADMISISSVAHRVWELDVANVAEDTMKITLAEDSPEYLVLAELEIPMSTFLTKEGSKSQQTLKAVIEGFKPPSIQLSVQFVEFKPSINYALSKNAISKKCISQQYNANFARIRNSTSDNTIGFDMGNNQMDEYEYNTASSDATSDGDEYIRRRKNSHETPEEMKRIDDELFRATKLFMLSKGKLFSNDFQLKHKHSHSKRSSGHGQDNSSNEDEKQVHQHRKYHYHRRRTFNGDDSDRPNICRPDVGKTNMNQMINISLKHRARALIPKGIVLPKKKKIQSLNYLLNSGEVPTPSVKKIKLEPL